MGRREGLGFASVHGLWDCRGACQSKFVCGFEGCFGETIESVFGFGMSCKEGVQMVGAVVWNVAPKVGGLVLTL